MDTTMRMSRGLKAFCLALLVLWAASIICSTSVHDTARIVFDVVMFSSAVFVLKNFHLLIAALPFNPLPFDELPAARRTAPAVPSIFRRPIQPPDNSGYVYLVKEINGVHYKIGRTVNPKDRLRTFNVKLPYQVDYLCVIATPDMYSLERQLHTRFKSKRVKRTEWFALTDEDVSAIVALAQEAEE